MSKIRYTKEHEWIRLDGKTATVGISNYAQEQLGDVVFVDLPDIGKTLAKGDEAAVVESVKAASEIYAPMSGEVIEVNEALDGAPGKVNSDAEGEGWFLKLKVADDSEFDDLMDELEYKEYLEEEQ
ncbi:MAG TPA: glycine cleavage system protein GcvH [Aestuariivirgaceae bacterium]|nr:glycine cleavage system protein GcvH [Aestuariivirgaceae bacterium]